MNTIEIGRQFEDEALNYLKNYFDRVERLEYGKIYDLIAWKDNKKYYIECKILKNGLTKDLPSLRYTQRNADYFITKQCGKIRLFDKNDIKWEIRIEKNVEFIKIKQKTINRLKKYKLTKHETYDDLINRILDHFEGDGKL